MRTRRQKEGGMALILVTLSLVIVMGALSVIVTRVTANRDETAVVQSVVRAEEVAQAGVDLAIQQLWDEYNKTAGNTTQNWASYREYLNDLGIPINEDLDFDGVQDDKETGNGNGVFDTLPDGADPRGLSLLDEPVILEDPQSERVLGTIDSVFVSRYDTLFNTRMTVRATGTVDGVSKTAVQVLDIGGREIPHPQFAVLTMNISCILCHADILSLDLALNNDPTDYGTFDRIKVASLSSTLIRKGGANSRVAGTTYTRGRVYKQNGSDYSDSDLAGSSFDAFEFSGDDGRIVQDGSGNMNEVNMDVAEVDAEGLPEQFANFYRDYPTDSHSQVDGPVPTDFPAPFPDDNGNRFVDESEFEAIVETSSGRLSFGGPEDNDGDGSLTAGVAYGVPEGDFYSEASFPSSSNAAAASLQSDGSYDGNLVLVGTEDDPIQLDGTVAVDGDLLIRGPIRGEGALHVRGNAYIMGDVTYDDDPGTFGQHTDDSGVTKSNAFALVAGGSVLIGDYVTVRGVNHSSRTGDKYPKHQKYSIDVREANVTGSEDRNGSYEELPYGYFDDYSIDANEIVDGRPGQQFSFTMSELQLFNKLELDTLPQKLAEDPSYRPRFYGLRESQPDNLWVWDAADSPSGNEEHAVQYGYPGVEDLGEHMLELGFDPEIYEDAAIHYLNPSGNWISEDIMRQMWYEDEMARPSNGGEVKFDGLIYSNNAIFAIVRSGGRHNSNTKGKMDWRGGVIAPDLGVFVPGGLDLYYDPRVERFLDFRDTTQVAFHRAGFFFEDVADPDTESYYGNPQSGGQEG